MDTEKKDPKNAEYADGNVPDFKSNLEVVKGETYEEHRKKILDAVTAAEDKTWEVSLLMSEVYDNEMYLQWGFGSFKDYVDQELGFEVRTAQHHINIQKWFGILPPKAVKWAKDLGWTKCRILLSVVTKENVDEWKRKVKGKTVKEIQDLLKESRKEETEEGSEGSSEPAKEKLIPFRTSFYPEQDANVKRAIDHVKEIAGTDKTSHALDLICTEYNATNVGDTSLQDYLVKVEKNTGVRLMAYSITDDAWVYGSELIQELEEKDNSAKESETPS